MRRSAHRSTANDTGAFARNFVISRLVGFEKDIQICLTAIPSKARPGPTHAYFPALAACSGTIEYLTGMYCGRVEGLGWRNVHDWARTYLPQPDYSDDIVRVLFEAFRNSVAHRGIATGIWRDQKPGPTHGRRITWKIFADARRPSIRIVSEDGVLTKDPPWPCKYTHRVHIHLKSMAVDIRDAATRYAADVLSDRALQDKFVSCMRSIYPQ
jgi:hypothetical protein